MIPVRSIILTTSTRDPIDPEAPSDLLLRPKTQAWQLAVRLHEEDGTSKRELATSTSFRLIIGDFAEASQADCPKALANSTVITIDLERSVAVIWTSLTGLPPLFAFRDRNRTLFSSPFIPEAARGHLSPDLDGIADTLRWGHPIDGRTLFSDLSVIASSSVVTIDEHGEASTVARTGLLDAADVQWLRPEELIEEQMSAFDRSAERIQSENAFVSLSGGLDSRTSVVGLIKHGKRIPCVTMSNIHASLDVRLAKAFCTLHGLQHHTITLGDDFMRLLPDLAAHAADLTGGVSCLSQTADLYLHAALGPDFTTRISGNLGNQVGRGGVESLSAYDPLPEVFSPEVRQRLASRQKAPWFVERLSVNGYGEVLFGQEVHYWSVANYVVGSSRARQLTPYADHRLFQLSLAALAANPEFRRPTIKALRARDLRHRFAGTPKSSSFQRRFLIAHDTQAHNVPLNWGWYAAGGWSPKWVASAAISASDAALIKLTRSPTPAGRVAKWMARAVPHPSTLVDWPPTIKKTLRDLALTTFNSRPVRDSGIFNHKALDVLLREHFFGGADHHHTVYRSLEISLGLLARASHAEARQSQNPIRLRGG